MKQVTCGWNESSPGAFPVPLLSVGYSQQALTLLATTVPVPWAHCLLSGQLALSQAGLPGVLQILARCDIMVLQEVVDSSGSAIPLLLRELNR